MRRKLSYALALALGAPVMMLADDPAPTVDFTQFDTAATQIKAGFEQAITKMTPIVVAIIIAGLGLWLIPILVDVLKKAFSKVKGR